jgi:serine protease Do
VIEGASRIRVQYHDGREFGAVVIGSDPPTDLAVIRITPDDRQSASSVKDDIKGYPAMPSGNSETLRVGEWVIAVGSPYGLSQTVTTGIISAKGRHNTGINSYENFLQTDAAINPGNSGGALLNLQGELVGINTAIFSRSGGYQGIGFAIPVNMARKVYTDLRRDGEVTRGWLGVSIQPLDPALAEALGVKARRGALVGGVIAGSPADKAGIKRGDVVTRIDQQDIPDPNTLLNHIALLKPGVWVEIGLNRAGKSLVLKARITKRQEGGESRSVAPSPGADDKFASLGLSLEAITPALRRDFGIASGVAGALVTGVQAGRRAEKAGLVEGDVIVEANRVRVRSPQEFAAIARKAGKASILLVVHREGETFLAAL